MIDWLVPMVMRLLFPRAPSWISTFLAHMLPAIVETVKVAVATKKIDPALVIQDVRATLDEALDVVPGWGKLDETRRDTMLDGLTELALWLCEVLDKDGDDKVKPAEVRKLSRQLRRKLKKDIR